MSSPILAQIMTDIKETMKAKDSERLITLRSLHSEIKNVGIDKRKEITDEDVAAVIAKGIKQREDSIAQYTAAGRNDLVEREQKQIQIYKSYQPKQLQRDEIEALVTKIITETGATAKKDLGLVMKVLMPLVKGKADGKMVNEIVNSKLP